MSTVHTTCERPADPGYGVDGTVVALDTPLMRAVERHPAGRALVDGPRTSPRASVPRRPSPRAGSPRAGSAAAAHGRSSSYRLTRRGRIVVFLAALVAAAGLTVGLGAQVIATSDAGDPVPSRAVVVEPGQTVWDIASAANPGGDIRETVREIADLNALESAGSVASGSTIYVPYY